MALVVMASQLPLGPCSTSSVASPFRVRGADVPIQQGPVLLLNGDQPLIQLKEQLIEADFPITRSNLYSDRLAASTLCKFIKLMESTSQAGCH